MACLVVTTSSAWSSSAKLGMWKGVSTTSCRPLLPGFPVCGFGLGLLLGNLTGWSANVVVVVVDMLCGSIIWSQLICHGKDPNCLPVVTFVGKSQMLPTVQNCVPGGQFLTVARPWTW